MEYSKAGNSNIKSITYKPVYVTDSETETKHGDSEEYKEASPEEWMEFIENSQREAEENPHTEDDWGKVITKKWDPDDNWGKVKDNTPTENTEEVPQPIPSKTDIKTCIYKYKKNAGIHKIGDICGDKVARNPSVLEGINHCSTHQPEEGTPLTRCSGSHFRRGEEVPCKHNISNPDDLYCLSCQAEKQRNSEKEKRRHERIKVKQNKPTCQRKLTKGRRRGKVCGKPCVIDEEYCKDCIKTNDARDEMEKDSSEEVSEESESESENEESENEEDENEEKDKERQEYEDKYPILKLPILDISNFHDLPNVSESTKKILKRLPLPQHIKYILAILPLKKETHPDELAAILKWYSNGQIRCESLTDKYYYQFSDDLKDWMKVPFKNKKYVNNLKTNIIQEVIKIYDDMLYNSDIYRDARKSLLENLAIEVSGKIFTYLISLLVVDALKKKSSEISDENILKFVNLHVERSNDRKKAITTTDFMDKYNEWCEGENIPIFTSGTVHFGRLLSRINKNNNRWGTFSNGIKKHIISFK